MCFVSVVMDWGRGRPHEWWTSPEAVKGLEDLLKLAKKYDVESGQPDCELAEKRKALEDMAELMGVKINFPE